MRYAVYNPETGRVSTVNEGKEQDLLRLMGQQIPTLIAANAMGIVVIRTLNASGLRTKEGVEQALVELIRLAGGDPEDAIQKAQLRFDQTTQAVRDWRINQLS